MHEAVHSLHALAAEVPPTAQVSRAERTTTARADWLARLIALQFVGATLVYVGAMNAQNSNYISGLTEDLLHTFALLLVYVPGIYAAKGSLRTQTVRSAFIIAVALMFVYRLLDIADNFAVLMNVPFVGTHTFQFVLARQLTECGAILGPLAAFYFIIQNLGSAHARLTTEMAQRTIEMGERQRTERALVESENKFRTLAQTTSAGIFIFKDSRCIYSNHAAQVILGYAIEELNVTPFWDRIPYANKPSATLESMNGAQRMEIRATGKNGETRWLDMTFGPMELDGERVVLGTAFDITERKQAERALVANEEWYRSLLQHSSDVFCVLRADGTFVYVAASLPEVLGPAPERTLVGKNVLDFVHPDERAEAQSFLNRAAEKPGTTGPMEVRTTDRHGNYRTFEIFCNNRLDSSCIRGIVVNAREVSERKQLEEQLRQSQKMDALGRLAGGVAHDFNNVLTSIFVYTEILDDRLQENPSLLTKVHEIRKAAERATRLTRQLLAFSRHQVEAARPMDLNVTIGDMSKMLECLIGEHINLKTDLQPGLARVIADPAHLEQVLLNLILNARDAMPDGGLIEISTSNVHVDEESRGDTPALRGPYVSLSIRDTGCGMNDVTKARLFEPFYTTKQEGKGTGLGLATVYGILQHYQARIVVASEPGQGATFTIYFPQSEIPAVDDDPVVATLVRAEGAETILVVEDDDEIRSLACRILSARGYTVLDAAAPEDALAIVAQPDIAIDLVVTDVVMPQMSGPAMVQRMRELRTQLRVMYISGYTNDSFQRSGLTLPPSGFLPKPFTAQVLAVKVREMLDLPDEKVPCWEVADDEETRTVGAC